MPRLYGIVEYRFVEPGWHHPEGWKVERISDQLAEDAYAERAERWLVRCRDLVRACGELGHDHEAGCARIGPGIDGERLCARWLRIAEQVTRTPERTVLVRVFVPAAGLDVSPGSVEPIKGE